MSSNETLLEPNERVLSTLNPDGSRRWLKPKPSPGTFRAARRIVAYLLIVVFSALPWITINGKPAMLLDVVHREFTFFGKTFLPTDTLLLALLPHLAMADAPAWSPPSSGVSGAGGPARRRSTLSSSTARSSSCWRAPRASASHASSSGCARCSAS